VQILKAAPDNIATFVTGDGRFGYAETAQRGPATIRVYNFTTGQISSLRFPGSINESDDRPATIWAESGGYVLYSPSRLGPIYALQGASKRFTCTAKAADLLIPGANLRCDVSNGLVKISACAPLPSLKAVKTIATLRLPELLYGATDGHGRIALLGEDPRVIMAPGRRLILLDTQTGRGSWFVSRFYGPLHWNGSTLAHYFPLGERDMQITPNLLLKPLASGLPLGTPLLNWQQEIQVTDRQTLLMP
jgi:hypothetical protein